MKNQTYTDDRVSVQVYILHLLNGKTLEIREEYDLPWEKGFVYWFEHANENEMFVIHNDLGDIYFLKRSVVCIYTGAVEKIDKATWQTFKHFYMQQTKRTGGK